MSKKYRPILHSIHRILGQTVLPTENGQDFLDILYSRVKGLSVINERTHDKSNNMVLKYQL